MNQERSVVVSYRLEKAAETLRAAQQCFNSNLLESSVNRIYYALFYAVNALLLCKGYASSKHTGVRALFNKEFIKTGLVEPDLGKFYSLMFDNRQEGDYGDLVEFQAEDIEQWLESANEFVAKINDLAQKIIEQ